MTFWLLLDLYLAQPKMQCYVSLLQQSLNVMTCTALAWRCRKMSLNEIPYKAKAISANLL